MNSKTGGAAMSDKLILEVFVDVDFGSISQLEGDAGGVVMIPFGGTAKGGIFSGIVRPGGTDTQTVDLNGVRHMSARYMLEGTDSAGEKCLIYIENNGHFPKDAPMPFKTVPTFRTDSKALGPYLHRYAFRGEGDAADGKLIIRFFEITQ
jgi:hypothetical protein